MRILIMDYINILLTRNAFPTTFGLKEAFQVKLTSGQWHGLASRGYRESSNLQS